MTDKRYQIEGYEEYRVPEGFGVIYEYYLPSLGMSYIGQTTDIYKRHLGHKRHGKLSPYIRADDYILNILEVAPTPRLDHLEKAYIKRLGTLAPDGLNISKGGRQNDLCIVKDFSCQIQWTFTDHSNVSRSRSERQFSQRVQKGKHRYYVYIPAEVVNKMRLCEGDLMDITIRYAEDDE